tara:strand:+ start:1441 stop:2280 length:840 start_codon:yes stop_codon:yes gene_type:complete
MTEQKRKEELLKYFVYVLVDPRDYKIFYVGKGQGFRNLDHKPGEEKEKTKKIKEIKESGYDVNKINKIIGRYETEKQALSVEATLIKWVYGKENLTNEIHGHGHSLIRSYSELKNKNFTDISGIDQERKLHVRSGDYTKMYKRAIQDNQISTKLYDLKEELNDNLLNLNINISEPNFLSVQDPCLLISEFSKIVQIQIRIPPKSGKYFTINYVPTSSKKKSQTEFKELILKKIPEAIVNNGSYYGKYSPYSMNKKAVKIYINNKKEIIDLIPDLIAIFK